MGGSRCLKRDLGWKRGEDGIVFDTVFAAFALLGDCSRRG